MQAQLERVRVNTQILFLFLLQYLILIRILVLGSKEYPFGTNRGDDPIPSGGMETYVNDLAPELSKLCSLTIITRKFAGTKRSERIGKDISVIRVPWVRSKWLRNPSFNLASFFKGLGLMRCMDVVYSNGIISGFFGMVLGKLFRKPSVYRPAGMGFTQFRLPLRQIMRALEKLVFSKSDAVLFHSCGEKRNARSMLGLRLDHGHVILTGFPVDRFKSGTKRLGAEFLVKDEAVISAVSRFVPVKGLRYMIEACSRLKSDYKLLLVGTGPEKGALQKLSQDLGVDDRVIFAGFRLDVPDILAITDIFVISSLSEGLPTSLLEAMAAKKACVVTDIGLPVEHMRTGLVVRPKDPIALRDAIDTLINDGDLRKKLGRAAGRFVEAECTQEKAAKMHLEMFRKITGGNGRSS